MTSRDSLRLDSTVELRSPLGPGGEGLEGGGGSAPSPGGRSDLDRGRRIGRFLVLGPLGEGGMGVVVEAHDEHLDRTVALKLLHPDVAARYHARLLREAQALARLSHPNVVQVYDVGTIGDRTFIAMELIRGRTLSRWQRERHGWRETVMLYLQAARGLAAAHDKDLVHRDFKPDNCILGDDGRVRVLDFGLVHEVGGDDGSRSTLSTEADAESSRPSSASMSARLTREGVVVGTLAYMSLEQLVGQATDARTDQYAFCASLHEALLGALPYDVSSPSVLLDALLAGRRSIPAASRLPRRLRRALERGLSPHAADRWPSMHALIVELEAITSRRRWWSAAAMLGVGVALGGGLVLTRSQPDPCGGADSTLGGTWDDGARQRLAEAFGRHGPADADTLLPRITRVFDEYAQGWAAMALESCTATFVTHRQSQALFERRVRCLERRHNLLAAAVEALTEAEDSETLVQSVILPFKLPGLAACADANALADQRAAVEEPVHDERHDELRRGIDRAHSLRESGRFEQALRLAEATADEAAAIDASHLHAEALECLGRIQAEGGPVREARGTLEQAIVEANRVAADEVAARAWLSLLYVITVAGDPREAEHRVLGTTAAVERTGDALLHAWLLNDRGILASTSGDAEAAQVYLEEALDLKLRTLGEGHVDVGIAWINLGAMFCEAGRFEEAREPLAEARSIFEGTVGRSNPLTTYALINTCAAEHGVGDLQAAIDVCGTAIARIEASPVGALWESRVRLTMAEVLWKLGYLVEARTMAEHAADVVALEDRNRVQVIQAWLREHLI